MVTQVQDFLTRELGTSSAVVPGQRPGAESRAVGATPRPVSDRRSANTPGVLDQIVLDIMGVSDDPQMQEIAIGLTEAFLSQSQENGGLGFRVHLPRPGESAANALALQKEQNQLQISVSKDRVLFAKAAINMLEPSLLSAFGFPKQSLEEIAETDVNRFMDMAEAAKVPVTRFDLTLAGQDIAVTSTEQRERAAASLSASADIVKDVQFFAEEGADVVRAQFKGILEQFGVKAGQIDTDAGAEKLPGAIGAFFDGAIVSPTVAANAVISEYGSEIKDQLEGLGKDSKGFLIVGKGEKFLGIPLVSDDATFFLSSSLIRLAVQQGTSIARVMEQVGLGGEYAGLNMPSFMQALERIAAKKGAALDRPEWELIKPPLTDEQRVAARQGELLKFAAGAGAFPLIESELGFVESVAEQEQRAE